VDDCCVDNFDCVQPGTCQDGCCVAPPPPPCPPQFNRCDNGNCKKCNAGQVFDAASCTCSCAEHRTCCSCTREDDSAFLCFPDIANEEFCRGACDAAGGNLNTVSFAGGGAANAVCDFENDQCKITCGG
jgi:hypothetical protein